MSEALDEQDHWLLMLWAADCAERVLPSFEGKYPGDARPRKAVDAGRSWAWGKLTVGRAREAAFAAHAAARDADHPAAIAAARAAGHVAGTAHVAGHARHAADYAVKAATAAATPNDAASAAVAERDWQYQHIPEHLRPTVFP